MFAKPDVFTPGGRTDWLTRWEERERKFVPLEVQAFTVFIFAKNGYALLGKRRYNHAKVK